MSQVTKQEETLDAFEQLKLFQAFSSSYSESEKATINVKEVPDSRNNINRDDKDVIDITNERIKRPLQASVPELKPVSTSADKSSKSSADKSSKTIDLVDRDLSDEKLKARVFSQPFSQLIQYCTSCTISENNKACLRKCELGDIIALREEFWGKEHEPFPIRKQRTKNLTKCLEEAYDRNKKVFRFKIGKTMVCESAYLRGLGKYLINNLFYSEVVVKRLNICFYIQVT